MRKAYCTIITLDYLHFALTLNESLLTYDPDVQLKVLISDAKADLSAITSNYLNIEFYFVDQLCQEGVAKRIYEKYAATEMDCFRWSIKPVFINFLLDQQYDQVFLLDSDLYFFASYDFLSDDLGGSGVLLTPHWRASNPELDETNFSILQTSGLFNAGFVGATRHGKQAMEWWAAACAYKCKKAPNEGLFVDQAYLDLLSIYFDNVEIERHRGCNVANWNQVECQRVLSKNGKVLIRGGFEIVFIHFTKSTINGIISGKDYLLKSYLDEYQDSLSYFKAWVQNSAKIEYDKVNICIAQNTTFKKNQHNNLAGNDLFLNPVLKCGNLDRYIVRKSILNALKTQLVDFEGTLLDVGCGQMPYKALLTSAPSQVTKYIGLDLEDSEIHKNNPEITWKNCKIPLAKASVDCAIATEVFEHCHDPGAVMSEICRVLKPGGLLFFTVPFLWPLHEVPHDDYRYTPFSLRRHLIASGFASVKIEPLGGWDASMAQMLGLWVRRRPIGKLVRRILSIIVMPVIYLLLQMEKGTETYFNEGTMITGLSGICRKPSNRNT